MDNSAPPSTRYLFEVSLSVTSNRKFLSFWPTTLLTELTGWPDLLLLDVATTSSNPLCKIWLSDHTVHGNNIRLTFSPKIGVPSGCCCCCRRSCCCCCCCSGCHFGDCCCCCWDRNIDFDFGGCCCCRCLRFAAEIVREIGLEWTVATFPLLENALRLRRMCPRCR